MIIYQNLEQPKRLKIGYLGENDATKIVFDLSKWASEYGEGYLTVLLERYGEDYAYPVSIEQTGHEATWLVSNIDVAIVGMARAQVEYRVDNVLAKTMIFRVDVENSLDNSGEVPEPYESILSQIVEEAHEVAENTAEVERLAEVVANDVETAHGYANESARQAGLSADSARESSGYADDASRYADNASASAEQAEQSVLKGGYINADIIDGHLVITYVNIDNLDFSLVNGRLVVNYGY